MSTGFKLSAPKGMMFLAAAMFFFASNDAIVKSLSATLPVPFLLLISACLTSLVFYILCKLQGIAPFARAYWHWRLVLRALTEAATALFFAFALARAEIGVVIAVFQLVPMTILLISALVFKRAIGPVRYGAILLGFAGVMIALQPWATAFNPAALIVLGAVACITLQDFLTQSIPEDIPSPVIGFQAFVSLIAVSALLLALSGAPTPLPQLRELIGLLAAAGTMVLAYLLLVYATRHADLTAISISRYARLAFAILFGLLVFNETPNALAWLGFALIFAAGGGLYLYEHARAAVGHRK